MEERTQDRMTVGESTLMEHGLLERLLLIYEEVETRLIDDDSQLGVLGQAASIMRRYFHGYHEKIEEAVVFPLIRGDRRLAHLAKTLRTQHAAALTITDEILDITGLGVLEDTVMANRLSDLIDATVVMYRPHMAWEASVLIPGLRRMVGDTEYEALGDLIATKGQESLGADAFENTLNTIEALEQDLDIDDPASFTPSGE